MLIVLLLVRYRCRCWSLELSLLVERVLAFGAGMLVGLWSGVLGWVRRVLGCLLRWRLWVLAERWYLRYVSCDVRGLKVLG